MRRVNSKEDSAALQKDFESIWWMTEEASAWAEHLRGVLFSMSASPKTSPAERMKMVESRPEGVVW